MEVNVNAESKEELQILTKANKVKPKKEDMKALRKLFDERPELWQKIANLNNLACRNVIGSITTNALFEESMKRATKELKRELGYDDSSMLDRQIIDAVSVEITQA